MEYGFGIRIFLPEECGRFWSLKLYRDHFKKSPSKSKWMVLKHEGKSIIGVVLQPSAGKAHRDERHALESQTDLYAAIQKSAL